MRRAVWGDLYVKYASKSPKEVTFSSFTPGKDVTTRIFTVSVLNDGDVATLTL